MSRRRRAEKRKILPDLIYKSVLVTKFINKVMKDGKKSLARKIVYNSIEKFAKKAGIKRLYGGGRKGWIRKTKPLGIKQEVLLSKDL